MKFTKRQVITLSVQFAVIAILCMGLLIAHLTVKPVTPASATPYARLRSARISLSPDLESEINIGGSGNDGLIAAYASGGKLYVFATAETADLDAEGSDGSFAAVLSGSGDTENFFSLDCGKVKKVLPHEDGFIAAGEDGGKVRLRVFSPDGTTLKSAEIDGGYEIADLFADDEIAGGYVVMLNDLNKKTGINSLRAVRFRPNGETSEERVFTLSYSLRYIKSFVFGSYYVSAVQADGQTDCFLSMVKWNFRSSPAFNHVTLENRYDCPDVLPHGKEYLALITESGEKKPAVVTVNSTFDKTNKLYLSGSDVTSGKIFLSGDDYYVFLNSGDDRSACYRYELSSTLDNRIAEFNDVSGIFSAVTAYGETAVLGKSQTAARLITMNGGVENNLSFGGASPLGGTTVTLGGKLFAILEMNAKTADCPENFGGTDLWVVSVRV